MLDILYIICFIKFNLSYFRILLFDLINNMGQGIEIVIRKKYLIPKKLSSIFPFIYYEIYTFYEQG